ncbi:hypothetical protein IDH44_21130 [Paenibacillus sp. IB182496]|uniref:Uncharacterized protein n=1 Tax=Paenibacillus sabuli TaxID=2772509 RepID=A0A927BYL4_9BACL|nr:hypothetical protein [Paenibacillus sabuli]MBD2847703.1 hypothetical protein [Paenibacillus sabuli]
MSKRKRSEEQAERQSTLQKAKHAENAEAASTRENRNQKGHVPNSPSTG